MFESLFVAVGKDLGLADRTSQQDLLNSCETPTPTGQPSATHRSRQRGARRYTLYKGLPVERHGEIPGRSEKGKKSHLFRQFDHPISIYMCVCLYMRFYEKRHVTLYFD